MLFQKISNLPSYIVKLIFPLYQKKSVHDIVMSKFKYEDKFNFANYNKNILIIEIKKIKYNLNK